MSRRPRPTICRSTGCRQIGLPASAAHPQTETHHMGLYFMASRGALLASELT